MFEKPVFDIPFEECKYCPYEYEGKCYIGKWLCPDDSPSHDINECLILAY